MTRAFQIAFAVTQVALWLAPAVARAEEPSLDGIWERDDKKTYRILGHQGIEDSPKGEFGCRFEWSRTDDEQISWKLRFTRLVDESGWLATTAVTTAVPEGPTPEKLEMDFEWVDLDPSGKVRERGTESHTLRRTRAITEHEEFLATSLALNWHARIDGYLATGSAEYDVAAALDTAGRSLFADGYGVPDDKSLLARQKALTTAVAHLKGSRPIPKAPATLEVPGGVDSEKVHIRVTNATTRPMHAIGVFVHPCDKDGVELVQPIQTSEDFEKPLEPGDTGELTLLVHPWSEETCATSAKAQADLAFVEFEDGSTWHPFDPPLATTKPLPAKPLEVEYLGQVMRHTGVSTAPPSSVSRLRIKNRTPGTLTSFSVAVHYLAADGHELGTASVVELPSEPLRPGASTFAVCVDPLPPGTKSVTAEASLLWFAPRTHEFRWEKGRGLIAPE